MRTLFCLFTAFALPFTSTAVDLPENPPDDFFISYEVKGIIAHEATHITDFKFTASASGDAFLEFKGKEGATLNINDNSVKKLYNAVRKSNVLSIVDYPVEDETEATEIAQALFECSVVANGKEKTVVRTFQIEKMDVDGTLFATVLEVLDENRPGWRDK